MDFYNVFLNAHKGIGYLVLLLVLVFTMSLLICMFGYSGRISKLLKKSTLITMILFHIQVLVGIPLLLIFSPGFKAALDSGTLMKDSYARHTFVEHPFSMLVAAILLTIVYRYTKTHETIAMKIVIFGVIAVAFFAYAFPWMRVFGA
ncbi:hypothetical protein [Halpernia sp.]|uniref:hypothetical protein n=1 Tax=Halpernia sp. TaxID=2782209 RepID=UPI003A95535D